VSQLRKRRVDQLRAGDTVFSPNLGRAVKVLATTRSMETKVSTVNGLRISAKHPIKLESEAEWVLPQDVAGVEKLTEPLVVYNLVLSEGGTVRVNNMTVITLGDNVAAGMSPVHPYYGTSNVVDYLKALPTWPDCEWGPTNSTSHAL